MKLIVSAPINNLSFGNVSINILRELYKKGIKVSFFPNGRSDLSSFDRLDKDFLNWIKNCEQYNLQSIDKNTPTLTLWHLNGSHQRISKQNHLLTFYELDDPTFSEQKMVEFQDSVFLTSQPAIDKFKELGATNLHKVNLGLDPDFFKMDQKIVKGKTHFILMGKYEKRKHTKDIVKLWLKKFGNNNKYLLSCCIHNPFFNEETMRSLLLSLTDGNHYSNLNFLPHLKTNTEVNHLINSADIDLTGLSGAEGWNLPSFNATALGKWSIVYNHTGHKSWATKDNSILLEPNEKEKAEDGVFFKTGSQWNQGNIFKFDEKQVSDAMDKALEVCQKPNTEGEKLAQSHTYEKTVENILRVIKAHNP